MVIILRCITDSMKRDSCANNQMISAVKRFCEETIFHDSTPCLCFYCTSQCCVMRMFVRFFFNFRRKCWNLKVVSYHEFLDQLVTLLSPHCCLFRYLYHSYLQALFQTFKQNFSLLCFHRKWEISVMNYCYFAKYCCLQKIVSQFVFQSQFIFQLIYSLLN